MYFRNIQFLLLFLGFSFPCLASYTIKGKVNMKGQWQHQIYLATIDKLDTYYSDDAKYIINVAPIDLEGNFEIKGDNLPDIPQFYRLYLVKEAHSEFNACLFIGGEEHNFLHLLLDNESEVVIHPDTTAYAPFGNYQIAGDSENRGMQQLGQLVYPSYVFYEMRFPSELRFARDKSNRDLFHFADTCSSTLVSLAAILNTDFDEYFDTQQEQYQAFGEELKAKLPNHPYTKDYFRKLRYYGDDGIVESSSWWKWATLVLSMGVLFLGFQNFRLRRLISSPPLEKKEEEYNFTNQELKILSLIEAGKSNKEIATDLFIEVSTVKSHINKLYAKMKVSNRKAAITKAKNLNLLVNLP